MIPRTIHYCWFGPEPLPKRVKKCIRSWEKLCPDYQIVRWNEQNFDIHYNQFTKDAYEAGKWAFVSDVARLYIIYHHGGIYLDTDVELLKPLDSFLNQKAFMGVEYNGLIATGLGFGAEKHMEVIKELLDEYDRVRFDASKPVDCPKLTTEYLTRFGYTKGEQIQTIRGITIYPSAYFAPMDWLTGRLHKTQETVSIHYYLASWTTKKWKQKKRIRKIYCTVLGKEKGLRFYERCANICKSRLHQTDTIKEKNQ